MQGKEGNEGHGGSRDEKRAQSHERHLHRLRHEDVQDPRHEEIVSTGETRKRPRGRFLLVSYESVTEFIPWRLRSTDKAEFHQELSKK